MLLSLMSAPPALLIPGPILAVSSLSLTARCLLAQAAATLSATATNSELARRIGYPRHRIQRALAELENVGYLHRSYTLPPVRRRLLVFTFPAGLTPPKSQFPPYTKPLPPKPAPTH